MGAGEIDYKGVQTNFCRRWICLYLDYTYTYVKDIKLYYLCPGYLCQLYLNEAVKIVCRWASLVAQWLRICLLMQGTRVRALVWEDPTCRGATRPVSHNY